MIRRRLLFLSLAAAVIQTLFFLATWKVRDASAQDPEVSKLIVTSREDGFRGTFTIGELTYPIENYVKEKSFLTSIKRPNGTVLIEARRDGEITLVALPTGQIKIDANNPGPFSSEESTAIRNFIESEDAATVRRIVHAIIANRKSEKHPMLNGFSVIAMLIGEA